MKSSRGILTCLFLIGMFCNTADAQTPYKLKSHKTSVAGTSSLHEWESEVKQLEWSGFLSVEDKKIVLVKDVVVKISVRSIKSTKGSMMDNKTYEAFNYKKNPNITFKLGAIKISNSVLDATGTLTMAGSSKSIGITVKGIVLPNGDIQLTGNKKIKMTEFGMEPPTAMLGTIKVGDEVTVAFDLTLTQ